MIGGQLETSYAKGVEVAAKTQCLTDVFTVSNQDSLPHICGTMTGEHVYFDASPQCNSLDFTFANAAVLVGTVATRAWNIKVTQYSCDYMNLAPSGCDQWFFGSEATGYVYSFNYNAGSGLHLAEQRQTICVRREAGNCRICWWADTPADDVDIGGKKTKGYVKGETCCNYGESGWKGLGTLGGYDCLMIPGAVKKADSALLPASNCGGGAGLVGEDAAAAAKTSTLCSKSYPFRISFYSDKYEMFKTGGEVT